MTLCGLLRLDGADVRRSTLTAIFAASSLGIPAVRGVHFDGPFGVMTAPSSPSDPLPPIAVDHDGLVAVVEGTLGAALTPGWRPRPPARPYLAVPHPDHPRPAPAAHAIHATHPDERARPVGLAGAAGTDACLLAVDYRAYGEGCLTTPGGGRVSLVWEPARRRLVVARTGLAAPELLTWSDGRVFAFGTETSHLAAAGMPRVGGIADQVGGTIAGRVAAAPRAWRRLATVGRLAAGDRVAVTAWPGCETGGLQ